MLLRKIGSVEDALQQAARPAATTGRALRNDFLASRLADVDLGAWALSAAALNYLEERVRSLKPRLVIEFGSGASTACLARFMHELYEDGAVRVLTIEQDAVYAEQTRVLLRQLMLEHCVEIHVCAVRDQIIEGVATRCYDLTASSLHLPFDGRKPDFVVIDGPADVAGARFGTIPLIRELLELRSPFYLDDALRDGELHIAEQWSALPYVHVDGVVMIDKGLLAGRVNDTSPATT